MEAGGVFHMPAGCWTDDGGMTLASLDSILTKGGVDPDDKWAVLLHGVGDTVGAVAGLYYGYENVPEDRKKAMKKRDELEKICGKADDVNIRCLPQPSVQD